MLNAFLLTVSVILGVIYGPILILMLNKKMSDMQFDFEERQKNAKKDKKELDK